jgi:hypothetical protein
MRQLMPKIAEIDCGQRQWQNNETVERFGGHYSHDDGYNNRIQVPECGNMSKEMFKFTILDGINSDMTRLSS